MSLRLGRPFFRQFTTSGPVWAKKKSMATKFKLSFIISGAKDSEIHTETYLSSESFSQGFQGFRFTNPKTNTTYAATNLFDDLDPDVVYIAKHPFLSTRLDSHSQNQIFDKAFEEKACKTFEDHFQDRHVSRRVSQNQKHNAWRILTNKDGSDFAEWGGIWESSDGNIFFLEAKYFMDFDKLVLIHQLFEKSVIFLGLERSQATLYLAGNCWEPSIVEFAQTHYGFGVLTPSGEDLIVRDPPPLVV